MRRPPSTTPSIRSVPPRGDAADRDSDALAPHLATVGRSPNSARPTRTRSPPPPPRPGSRRSCPSTAAAPSAGTSAAQPGGELAQRPERGPRRLRLDGQPADRHEAVETERAERGQLRQRRRQAVGLEPGLAGVAVDVDLEEDREPPLAGDRPSARQAAELADDPIEPSGELDRVDRLDAVDDLERAARLVVLERPDEVPLPRPDGRRPSPRPPGPGSRRTGSWPAATAARTRSAGTVLETATSRTLAGSRPGAVAGRGDRVEDAATGGGERAHRRLGSGPSGMCRSAGACRRGSLAAQEARDLQLVGVDGRAARGRHGLADRSLGADDRDADGGRALVAPGSLAACPSVEARRWRSSSSRKSRSRPAREPPLASVARLARRPRGGPASACGSCRSRSR